MQHRLLLLLTAVIVVTAPARTLAWGQDGHRLVCGVAETRLSAEGRKFVEYVTSLGEHLDGKTPSFPESCLWPDSARYGDYRGTYEAHFINIPANARGPDLSRDCAALDCIVAAIQRNLVYLSAPAGNDRGRGRKAAALRFLGHFIADLHQPMHVAHGEDLGGNLIRVAWFGEDTNLHRVWDHHILERAGIVWPDSVDMLARVPVADADPGEVIDWMNQTFTLARQQAYLGPDQHRIVSGDRLDQAYFVRAKPVVIEQLARAGARLAALINGIAIGDLDPAFLKLQPRRDES